MRITFQRGSRAGESKEFAPPGFFIGRECDNDIVLDCEKVSQHHLKIFFDNGVWSACDLGSSNGTRVNGEKLSGIRVLESNDMIYIGTEALKIEIPEPSAASADDSNGVAVKIRPPAPAPEKQARKQEKPSNIDGVKTGSGSSADSVMKRGVNAEKRKLEQLLQDALAEKRKKLTIISIIIAVVANVLIFLWWFFRIGFGG
ncbi:MAG: FHA domain-containing protein [Victivallales bacterium]|nr:FHA domain-containing protein [Victivallales bacterium]